MSIGIIIISIVAGLVFYYLISPLPVSAKKKQLEEVISLLINFIIYIWVGKIIVNFIKFTSDPLAVLAYPSNSGAFYIAIFLLVLNVLYKKRKNEFNVMEWLSSFTPVVLGSSFTYEFIQLTQKQTTYRLSYLVLLMVLLIVFIVFQERMKAGRLTSLLLIGWSGGLLGLSLFSFNTTLFGYTMHSWFSLILLVGFLSLGYYNHRKQVS